MVQVGWVFIRFEEYYVVSGKWLNRHWCILNVGYHKIGYVWKISIPKILDPGKLERHLKGIPWGRQTFVGSKYYYQVLLKKHWLVHNSIILMSLVTHNERFFFLIFDGYVYIKRLNVKTSYEFIFHVLVSYFVVEVTIIFKCEGLIVPNRGISIFLFLFCNFMGVHQRLLGIEVCCFLCVLGSS